jgi:hypothetical protein
LSENSNHGTSLVLPNTIISEIVGGKHINWTRQEAKTQLQKLGFVRRLHGGRPQRVVELLIWEAATTMTMEVNSHG